MLTHFLAIVPFAVKLFRGKIWDALGIGTVLGTSVNYWRKPERGIRRNIDMAAVFSVGTYNMYRCPRVWCVTAPVCYVTWTISKRVGDTRIHSLLHVFGTIACIVEDLYLKK